MEWSGFGTFQMYPFTITLQTGPTMNLQLRPVFFLIQEVKVEIGLRTVVMESIIQFARNLCRCQLRPKQLPHPQARVAKRKIINLLAKKIIQKNIDMEIT